MQSHLLLKTFKAIFNLFSLYYHFLILHLIQGFQRHSNVHLKKIPFRILLVQIVEFRKIDKINIILRKDVPLQKLAFVDEFLLKHGYFPVIHNFLNYIIFEESYSPCFFIFVNISGHFLDRKKLAFCLLILYFVTSDPPERNSKILAKTPLFIISNVETVGFVFPVHIAKLFIEVWICLKYVQILEELLLQFLLFL